ncbi:MAG: RNA polymerase sigma-70 factor [Gemmatimonadetes bacterium]|nr:RNA polymerase sigma-70 factor [Gemmatimonadota bacterium]
MSGSPPAPEEATWVEKIRLGDQEAFGTLFRALYPSLCNLVTRRVRSPEIAEELVQDIFLRMWERRETLDPEQSITRYLYRAARNQAINHLKHRNIASRAHGVLVLTLRPTQPAAEDEVRYTEIATAAQDAINHLPDRCREIFLLSRQGEQSYSDIAHLLGISIKTVETQMGRALKTLRSALLPYL